MKRMALAVWSVLVLAACGGEPRREETSPAPHEAAADAEQEAQRVQVGMTRAQVVAILGEPRARVGQPDGERLTFWSFDAGRQLKARVYVMLDNSGKVVEVQTIPL